MAVYKIPQKILRYSILVLERNFFICYDEGAIKIALYPPSSDRSSLRRIYDIWRILYHVEHSRSSH